jgi:hypothetical protein
MTLTSRSFKPSPTQQHGYKRRYENNGQQPVKPQLVQQVALSKADDVKGDHEERDL